MVRLGHRVYGSEIKNLMERFIQHIKDRTECFDDRFPVGKVRIVTDSTSGTIG
jgi:hypothetical protein